MRIKELPPKTNAARLLHTLQDGRSPMELNGETGLKKNQISNAFWTLRRGGDIEITPADEVIISPMAGKGQRLLVPGSQPDIVYTLDKSGVNRYEMPAQAGLNLKQVAIAYHVLYSRDLVKKPPRKELFRQKREAEGGYRPKPGSNPDKVLKALDSGVAQTELKAALTDLSDQQIHTALSSLRRRGLISQVNKRESNERRRASVMEAKKSIWPYIGEYAEMGMTPREIEIATRVEKRMELDREKIAYTVGKAKYRAAHLPRPSLEEKKHAAKIGYLPYENVEKYVKDWLGVKNVLFVGGLQTIVQNRVEWALLIDFARELSFKWGRDRDKFKSLDGQSEDLLQRLDLCFSSLEEHSRMRRIQYLLDLKFPVDEIADVLKITTDEVAYCSTIRNGKWNGEKYKGEEAARETVVFSRV